MNITIIGTGYVGLVTGTCFAEMGNTVTCVDIDHEKIDNLNKGISPIYEPGLEGLIRGNEGASRLSFTTSLQDAMKCSNLFLIAVGTPQKLLDVSRLKNLGWQPSISLEEGIKLAYGWYLKNVA